MREARYTTLAPLANVIIISQFHGLSGATISFLTPCLWVNNRTLAKNIFNR